MSPRYENPYMNRVMIRDPAEFVGRKVEIEKVFSRIGAARPQSVSIVGERRIGKSSLLYHLSRPEVYTKNLADPSRYVFVLVDLHGLGDLNVSEFFDLLLDEISAAAGISRPQGISSGYFAMKQFLPELHRNGRKLVLLWDEFDSVTRNRKFGEEFFSFFRSMANRYDIAYVTTAVRELQEICHTESVAVSPFFNIFTNLYLRTFSPEEARELICGPSGRSEIPLDEHEPALLDVAGYFPFFLQLACCSLFDQLAQGVQKERAVERARLQFGEEARPHVLYACQHMEPELRELLRLIANGGTPPAKLSDLQEQLLRQGYLMTTRQGLKVFSSFFLRWLDEFDKTPTWTGRMPAGFDAETRPLAPEQRQNSETMSLRNQARELYEFGPFRLDVAERSLTKSEQIIPLTPKAFDTLVVLIRNRGHVVGKDELLKAVWPETFVEEGVLPVNVATIRKALSEGDEGRSYIETVARRGYRFVGEVRTLSRSSEDSQLPPPHWS